MYYQAIFKYRHWFITLFSIAAVLLIIYLLIFFFIPRILPEVKFSNTKKQGIIFRNERWSGEIIVTGDIWAFPGSTVVVAPGTKILISNGDHFNLHFLPWDLRSGLNVSQDSFGVKNGELYHDERNKIQLNFAKIYAIGTKQQPIEITSEESNSPSPYDFNGLTIDEGILGFVNISNYRRLLVGDKVTIRDSELTNSGECAVCIEYNNPTIVNNVFRNNLRNYIWVLGGSPKINDNLFLPSKGNGIVVDPHIIGAPIIYHNSFKMSNQVALKLLSGSEEKGGVVAFNDFTGSNKILLPCNSKMKFLQNLIGGVVEFAKSDSCTGSFVIGQNYWFSKDRNAIIREKILGKESSFDIVIPVVLDYPPANIGRRQ